MIISISITLAGLIICWVLLKVYTKKTNAWCRNNTSLVGKTVVVTGANEGIGFETALEFARRGAKVILACRNKEKAMKARSKISNETNNTNVHVKLVDLASFDSVRKFAKEMNKTEKQLDILINNAGIAQASQELTVDGHNEVLQVNYYSSFLLTHLLLGLLKRSKEGRIVNVSSYLAIFASNTDFTLEPYSHNIFNYNKSKLFGILFTKTLSQKLKDTTITTYSLHPGIVFSQIYNNVPIFNRILAYTFFAPFTSTCEEAAQTTIYCATEKKLEKYNGEHFHNCHMVSEYWNTKDEIKANQLWENTKILVALS